MSKLSHPKPMEAWSALNERQQTYLKAIYDQDQEQELAERERAARTHLSLKAEEWRPMRYAESPLTGNSPIRQRLVEAKVVDSGTGSTFEALETRGLISVRYEYQLIGDPIPWLTLTTLGRKVVRAGLDLKATPRKKPGELSARQQKYADKLIEAGIAPRDEVEAAFRAKSEESEERIRQWGSTLSMLQRQQREEYYQTHPKIETCAVCGKEIVSPRNRYGDAPLKPVRYSTIRYDVAGLAWGKWTNQAEEAWKRFDWYGCCEEHEQLIREAEMQIEATLIFPPKQEKQ